jgi:hypothetical protein
MIVSENDSDSGDSPGAGAAICRSGVKDRAHGAIRYGKGGGLVDATGGVAGRAKGNYPF